jgi:RNA polymerase sigma-70 factor (ECF subfamily)
VELSPKDEAILARFVDAFNRKDPDALLALLDADAAAVIVGVAEEHGRNVIRDQSLADELANPNPQIAELGFLFGEPVVLVYSAFPDQPRTLGWIIRLGLSGGRICRWYSYYFTPELIRHAADAIGVPASPAGYRYVLPGATEPLPTP